jgi:LacI family transcriptional regulator
MADVARAAQVSITTVSHVINGTRAVAPETRDRVRAAIETLGYQTPRGRTSEDALRGVIGLIVSETSYAHFAEVIQGAEATARELGYSLLVCRSHEDDELEQRVVETLIAHRVDGVMISPTPDWAETVLARLREREMPFVLLDRKSAVKCDQVLAENIEPSQLLVEHLIDLGHRRIAMLSGYPRLSTTAERLTGYRRALEKRGLPFAPELVVEGGSNAKGGRNGVRQLLELPAAPTAIFCSNDAMTVGALLGLRDCGRRVPDDVAVVAFDDFEWSDAFEPRLTAAAQPAFTIGERGVRMLVERIHDWSAPARTCRLPTAVVHRTSCGCASGS